ncbi:MAG TPA: cupredoxin domain-containing protein [Candidatus Baltobacteraceae bacterium]
MKVLLLASAMLAALGAAPAPAGPTVHIKDFAYHAATLAVAPGTTVHFVNDDGEAHTVTAVDKSFDSTGMDTGDGWTHTFSKPGTYAYFCALHPYMKGVIVVRPTGGTTP